MFDMIYLVFYIGQFIVFFVYSAYFLSIFSCLYYVLTIMQNVSFCFEFVFEHLLIITPSIITIFINFNER